MTKEEFIGQFWVQDSNPFCSVCWNSSEMERLMITDLATSPHDKAADDIYEFIHQLLGAAEVPDYPSQIMAQALYDKMCLGGKQVTVSFGDGSGIILPATSVRILAMQEGDSVKWGVHFEPKYAVRYTNEVDLCERI